MNCPDVAALTKGDLVHHSTYGNGWVERVDTGQRVLVIKFEGNSLAGEKGHIKYFDFHPVAPHLQHGHENGRRFMRMPLLR